MKTLKLKLILITVAISSLAQAQDYDAVDESSIRITKAVLNIREAPTTSSKIFGKAPKNSRMECKRRTANEFEIDGKMAPWYYCSLGDISGWFFGDYLALELTFQPDKNIFFESDSDKLLSIHLELSKDSSFKLHIMEKKSANAALQTWQGIWRYDAQELHLSFDGQKLPNVPVFHKRSKSSTPEAKPWQSTGKGTVKFDLSTGIIEIGGLPCRIASVFD